MLVEFASKQRQTGGKTVNVMKHFFISLYIPLYPFISPCSKRNMTGMSSEIERISPRNCPMSRWNFRVNSLWSVPRCAFTTPWWIGSLHKERAVTWPKIMDLHGMTKAKFQGFFYSSGKAMYAYDMCIHSI